MQDELLISLRMVGSAADIAILDCSGKLLISNEKQLADQRRQLLEQGINKIILNMADVSYVDASAIGELISCHSVIKENKGRFALLHIVHNVEIVLAITKNLTVFEIFKTEEAAIASFT